MPTLEYTTAHRGAHSYTFWDADQLGIDGGPNSDADQLGADGCALGAADQCVANLRALVATYQLGTFKL